MAYKSAALSIALTVLSLVGVVVGMPSWFVFSAVFSSFAIVILVIVNEMSKCRVETWREDLHRRFDDALVPRVKYNGSSIPEKIIFIVERGRFIGNRFAVRWLYEKTVKHVRRHELMHAWIFAKFGMSSIAITNVFFNRDRPDPLVSCGGCTLIGTYSFFRRIAALLIQFYFDFFHILVNDGLRLAMTNIVYYTKHWQEIFSSSTYKDVSIAMDANICEMKRSALSLWAQGAFPGHPPSKENRFLPYRVRIYNAKNRNP